MNPTTLKRRRLYKFGHLRGVQMLGAQTFRRYETGRVWGLRESIRRKACYISSISSITVDDWNNLLQQMSENG